MEYGVRVRVLPCTNYAGRYNGYTGTVVHTTGLCPDKVAVQLDKQDNPGSRYNAFWFEVSGLEVIESEESHMLLEEYVVAGINFLSGANQSTTYSYALFDNSIEVGDVVVVKTGHHGFALAKVVEIMPKSSGTVLFGREIVTKVDFTAYEERKAKRARIKRLKQEMDDKVKELQAAAIYEMLAEKDPQLRELLTEYQSLTRQEVL